MIKIAYDHLFLSTYSMFMLAIIEKFKRAWRTLNSSYPGKSCPAGSCWARIIPAGSDPKFVGFRSDPDRNSTAVWLALGTKSLLVFTVLNSEKIKAQCEKYNYFYRTKKVNNVSIINSVLDCSYQVTEVLLSLKQNL